jgi:hypothetical protein
MDSAMTHGYAVVLFCLGTITALSLALGVSSIVKRVIKKKTETHEPHAGKTLGL